MIDGYGTPWFDPDDGMTTDDDILRVLEEEGFGTRHVGGTTFGYGTDDGS